MTTDHRYILEPYTGRASRHTCPSCNQRGHTYKRYIDAETLQPLADHVGKCDRADQCNYHFPPRRYFAENGGSYIPRQGQVAAKPVKPFDTLPRQYVDDTAKAYHRNNFIHFLTRYLGVYASLSLAEKYKIGTSKHWPGATIFWQIDVDDRVRTGKIMLYNPTDGHRVKKPFNHITWAHSALMRKSEGQMRNDLTLRNAEGQMRSEKNEENFAIGIPTSEFNIKQCLFGEHLLHTDPYKTVAIAESEKTAIIASFFYPKYIWLASGSLEGLSWDKCKVLKDRRVILFPDVNGYEKWRLKARELNLRLPGATFTVDDTLERVASDEERARGIDIADRWIDQLTIDPENL